MYNQTRFEIQPSWRLSIIAGLPFVAAMILVLHMQISPLIQVTLTGLLILSGIRIIRKSCLLKRPDSIKYIDVSENRITSIDNSGRESKCTLKKAIIGNSLCLINVDLGEPISNKLHSKLIRNQHYILITKLNIEDFDGFRRIKALLTMCAHKL